MSAPSTTTATVGDVEPVPRYPTINGVSPRHRETPWDRKWAAMRWADSDPLEELGELIEKAGGKLTLSKRGRHAV